MCVTLNTFTGGRSHGFTTEKAGQECTVGELYGGSYDFGRATRREWIRVLAGKISTPDGKTWKAESDPLIFEVGDEIQFTARPTTLYACFYS